MASRVAPSSPTVASAARSPGSVLRRRARRMAPNALLHLVVLPLAVVFSVPLLWVISTSLKPQTEVFSWPIQWIPTHVRWSNYVEAITRIPAATFASNTAFIVVVSTTLTVLSSSMVGYSLARLRWRGRQIVFAVVVVTMMLPPVVTIVPAFLMYKAIGWVDTYLPLILPSSTAGAAFYIFLMRQYFTGLPYELEEAARIDGATSWRIWWQIMLPLCGPVLATVAIFTALHHYNDFMWPLIILSSPDHYTLALGLRMFVDMNTSYWHLIMAFSTLMLLPIIALFFIAQRYFIRGIHLTGLAGR
ncbi:MAG: carbohydrate ABC transporter permease [Chloroflexi bacterium]|nr:carbohydrate ABC transporter permease [Chloroflexota bacterium]